MKKCSAALVALCLSMPALAADLANGEKINRSCALCHGAYGQGAPGKLSPRIAGLPKYYLIRAIEDYRDGKRSYPLMNKTSGLDQMTEADVEDIAAYLSSIDLSSDARFNIGPPDTGNLDAGKELFNDECKVCHARDGYGKERKEAPPLAGQHPAYLYTYMDLLRLPTDSVIGGWSRLQTYIRSLCGSVALLPDPYGNRALAPHL
jgi:cytochrome c553